MHPILTHDAMLKETEVEADPMPNELASAGPSTEKTVNRPPTY